MSDFFTLYKDKNYKGDKYEVTLENKINGQLYYLESTKVHDEMSSVKWSLSDNKKVVFYEHKDGNGKTYTIQNGGSDPDTHSNNFGDCVSSWRLVEGDSIPYTFSKISTEPIVLKFVHKGIPMPSGKHMQGIQQLDGSHLVISGSSSEKAYFFIVEWADVTKSSNDGKVIKLVIINDDFPKITHNHAGGMQLCGNFLAVGLETEQSGGSSVVFYDLSNVNHPVAVGNKIDRKQKTAGAIGIVKRSSDYLLAVGGWNSDVIDFYISNNTDLASTSCTFTLDKEWKNEDKDTNGWIDGNWGSYEGLNLMQDPSGQLFLVGFNRNGIFHESEDWADLFSLNMNAVTGQLLTKIDKKHMYCKEGASFRWGSGLYAPNPAKKITILAVEANISEEMKVNIFSPQLTDTDRSDIEKPEVYGWQLLFL